MLVLSRTTGQTLVIGGQLTLTVASLTMEEANLWVATPEAGLTGCLEGQVPEVPGRYRVTLRKDESVGITPAISLVGVEIRPDRVRIGIQAPPDVPVYREEIWNAMNEPQA